MRLLLPLLFLVGVGCADLSPVVLPPEPVPVPTPTPTPTPVPTPAPSPEVSEAWAKAEAFVVRVQAGETVTVAEVSAVFGPPIPRHTRPDGMRVVTWRVPDEAGANILNVHAAVDATGRIVEVDPR